MDLSGAWKGYYEYGEGYYLPYFGERVKIEVVLSQSTNKIKGTSNELESILSSLKKFSSSVLGCI